VLLGENGKEGLGEQWRSFELMAAKGKRQDGDVEGACPKAIQQDGRDFLDDGDLHLREFPRKGCQERRQEVRGNRGNDADDDAAADGGFLLDNIAAGRFEFAENGPGSREKRLAKIREANGTAKAIEQAGTEFVFELEDLLRKRRLRDVRLLGRTAETAGFRNGTEVTKLMDFHRLYLSIVSELYIGSIGGVLLRLGM
jgi:hypothetical protein